VPATPQRPRRDVTGIVLLDKPKGLSSNAALQRAKRLLNASKAGHTGSLDPLATGLLPVCFGAATKVSGLLLDASKEYRVTAEFGVATDTGDAEGQVIARSAAGPPATGDVDAAVAAFHGRIEQIPTMFSVLKQGGRRLYELARRGEEVERAPRPITIHSLTLEVWRWPQAEFRVACSKGTYVRTLVTDLAERLGLLAHVAALRRLGVGPFDGSGMVDLERLERDAADGPDALDRYLLPTDAALAGWPRAIVDDDGARRLKQGQTVTAESEWPVGRVALYAAAGGFFGIGEVTAARELKPRKILC
jgi:tRNA pseudouridine55 synthase